MSRDPSRSRAERELVGDILQGSREAWHEFVRSYSGLLLSVIRRYIVEGGEDARRSVYVDVLHDLYHHKLKDYDDQFALSTWIVVVTRSRCLDALRHAKGRRQVPKGLRALSSLDQEIYRLRFIEGLDFGMIAERLSGSGASVAIEDVAESLSRIESRIDKRTRTRLAYDLQARTVGVTSGRLLQFLDEFRIQNESRRERENPEAEVIDREARSTLRRVRQCLEHLSPGDRQVLHLRFYERLTADAVAAELNLGGRRRAYTVIDRALSRLRRVFESGRHSTPTRSGRRRLAPRENKAQG